MLLGAHIPTANGLSAAVADAVRIGCNVFQLFVKSPRQWSARPLAEDERSKFKTAVKAANVRPAMAHASYLINLASEDPIIDGRSRDAIVDELIRCDGLQIPYLVMHPGSGLKSDRSQAIERVGKRLASILDHYHGNTGILLENTAGQGGTLGVSLEELEALIEAAGTARRRLGVCIDTQHAFASGYLWDSSHGYDSFWREFDRRIGLTSLRGIHMNDSQTPWGSRKDRHACIGAGEIPIAVFERLLADERFREIPMVLETPKSPDLHEDAEALALLRSLVV